MYDLFVLVALRLNISVKQYNLNFYSDTLFVTVKVCLICFTINSYTIPKDGYILLTLLTSSYVGGEHSDALYFWKQCLEGLV